MDTNIVIMCAMLVGMIFGGIGGWLAGWSARQNTPTEEFNAGYQKGCNDVRDLIRGVKPDGSHRWDIVEVER